MSKRNIFWIGMFVLLGGVLSSLGHTFTLPDGRSLEAEIVQYDERSGQVELKRTDGKLVKIKPSVFVKSDQDYITEWFLHSVFNGKDISVDINKKKVGQRKEDGNAHFMRIDEFLYQIEIENRSNIEISELDVEYRIFYEQEENDMDKGRVVKHDRTVQGDLEIELLAAKGKRIFSSKEVELVKYEFNSTEYYVPGGDPQATQGSIKGIWVRVECESTGGMKSVRDFYEPSSIEGKYSW
tara:strand:+ start:915 stop:1631 length:717 start_codon:yes stop_codon:yes gene_type:complete